MSGTTVGLAAALLTKLTLAASGPEKLGVNVSVIVQDEAAATGPVVQVFVCAKSAALAPVTVTLDTVRSVVPLFVTVSIWGALTVAICDANIRAAGLTTGTAVLATPVPDNPTKVGLPAALLAMLICAATAPALIGVNVAVIVHIPPPAKMGAPQVLVC